MEGYVREGKLDEFVRRHMLTLDALGDVTIYEAPESQLEGVHASEAAIAADLARSLSTRERWAGLAALEEEGMGGQTPPRMNSAPFTRFLVS